jgi:two-component sensor histidine kinase
MNLLYLISIFIALAYVQAGIYVLYRNVKSELNQIFFVLSLLLATWAFAVVFVFSAITPEAANRWEMVSAVGYCLFPAFMLLFNLRLCNVIQNKKLVDIIFGIVLLLGVFLLIARITGYWSPIRIVPGRYIWHLEYDYGSLYFILFYVYLTLVIIMTMSALVIWRLKMREGDEIIQFRLFFFPLLAFVLISVTTDIILPSMHITALPVLGHVASLPWIVTISFAIVRYKLMGLNVNNLVAENIIEQLKEIILFIDNNHLVVKTNHFTEKLLGGTSRNLVGQPAANFFENKALLTNYLRKAKEKQQLGPVVMTMKDHSEGLVDTSLYFVPINDDFKDPQGFIIYGHDNRESISLQKEIIVREHAEKNLRAISEVLEARVNERSDELTNSYKELQVKMTERMRVEEQIKNDISEKEVLINEIHNRVKSNMNIIISLITAYDKDNLSPAVSRKFKELARRVKALLLVHHNLYLSISYSDVDFSNFIRIIADELLVFYKRKGKVEIELDISDVFLEVDYAIPLGLIVNELISNSLTHAFSDYYLKKNPGKRNRLNIKYAFSENYYEISVADNGKGLPKDFDIAELSTNGLPLTEILVNDQVNGKMEFFSSDEGTLFRIVFLANK